jgi:hypothetical protein
LKHLLPYFVLFYTLCSSNVFGQAESNSVKKPLQVISSAADTVNSYNKLYCIVLTDAQFQSGHQGWVTYLRQQVDTIIPAMYGAKTGQYIVTISFVVGKDGSIKDIKPMTCLGYGMEAEVASAIQQSCWKPATRNGRVVNDYKQQSFVFNINHSSVERCHSQ